MSREEHIKHIQKQVTMAKKAKKRKKTMKKTKAAARKGDVVIITGASGVKPTRVLEKFNTYSSRKRQKLVEVVDFEDLLVEEALKDPICKASPTFQQELRDNQRIIAVTSLPYPLLKNIWDRAVQEACKDIEKIIGGGQHVALVMHAVYFKPDSTEFVPIVDAKAIQAIGPKCVVHLIDDIYDIYEWLRAHDGIFDHTDFPEDKFEQTQRCIRDLVTTLIWRQAEAGSSGHLAGLLGNIPVYTVATKHRCGLLERIFQTDVRPVYLSHPITEARRQAAGGDTQLFEKWAAEVGTLADHLSRELGVWEPTTIDELRLQFVEIMQSAEEDGNLEEAKVLLPRLLQRWPFGAVDDVLWSKPETQIGEPLDPALFLTDEEIQTVGAAKTWDQIEDLIGEDKARKLRFTSGQLAHLESLISEQINARDRTLVGQCPNIIVYRPVFNGNTATGVVRELQAHRRLIELQHYVGQTQAAVFVLENSSDERLVWRNAVRELLTPPKGRWSGCAKEQNGSQITAQRAQEIADFVTKNELVSEHIVNEMRTALQELKLRWGEPRRSVLDGAAKGQAQVEFERDRAEELENGIRGRMHYKQVLSTYGVDRVFLFRDIGVIDFANEVIKILTKKEG